MGGPKESSDNYSLKKQWFGKTLEEWGECGKLLYLNQEALAYIQYAPLSYFPQSKYFRAGPVSGDAVFISCLYVVPQMRGRGIGKVILQAVLKDLFRRKFKNVEAFASRSDSCKPAVPLDFYLKNGFYILRDDRKFPLVRLELKAAATWRVSVQTVLDSLKIPVRSPVPSR